MKLSMRLERILDFVSKGCEDFMLADIGTDHAFLPIEAVGRGLVKSAIASDIGEGPMRSARENITNAGLAGKIKTIVADGLAGLADDDADVISITGMGGDLMRRILEEGREVAKSAKKLILSPQSNICEFRKWLLDAGYIINKEACIIDEGKYYFILEVFSGRSKEAYSEFELAYGKEVLFSDEEKITRRRFIERELATYKKVLESLCYNNSDSAVSRKDELEREIKIIEDGLA